MNLEFAFHSLNFYITPTRGRVISAVDLVLPLVTYAINFEAIVLEVKTFTTAPIGYERRPKKWPVVRDDPEDSLPPVVSPNTSAQNTRRSQSENQARTVPLTILLGTYHSAGGRGVQWVPGGTAFHNETELQYSRGPHCLHRGRTSPSTGRGRRVSGLLTSLSASFITYLQWKISHGISLGVLELLDAFVKRPFKRKWACGSMAIPMVEIENISDGWLSMPEKSDVKWLVVVCL
ncbi:hypothetical protein AVEN_190029-1 [Araneus ventricosus]|uniref:Uncharacterized protein n=1 Tax=Araneus ventricosus TaxID=182803 RepID=A0A4Y2KTH3_ARAVE|nr:hypothetical protein AVEN_190029-1 [Araneus ventricosus]